jgi:hypothetical protein
MGATVTRIFFLIVSLIVICQSSDAMPVEEIRKMTAWGYSWNDAWDDAWGAQPEIPTDAIPINAAIMTKCEGSSLSEDVGGRIFCDEAPDGTEFPYVVFFNVTKMQVDTFKDKLDDVTVQFSLFSISRSLAEITTIYSHLKDLFDWQLIDISGDTCVWVVRQNLVTMFDDITTSSGTVGLRHWAVDYSIMVQSLT